MASAPPVQRLLFALASDPNSRFIRLVLAELQLAFSLKNPMPDTENAQQIPALQDENGSQLGNASVIAEYLDEAYGGALIGSDPLARAQVRQVWRYIDGPFADRVTTPLLYERIHRQMSGLGTPDSSAIQRANGAKAFFFKELERLADIDTWIAGPRLTLADLCLAAQLSLLDYLDLVPWAQYPGLADFYRRLKSRPAMRPLLAERLERITPSRTYDDLDF